MTSFMLKIIAIIFMLCDHVSIALIGHSSFWNFFGRIAFPIFAFQIAQGYIHTKDLKKYFIRLVIFACISQLPYSLFLSTFNANFNLNIMFTLSIGLVSIYAFDKIKNKYLGFLIVTFLCVVAQLSKCDYGVYGISIIFLFYIYSSLLNNIDNKNIDINIRKRKKILYKFELCIIFIGITIIKYIPSFIEQTDFFNDYLQYTIFTCYPLFLYVYITVNKDLI